MVVIRRESVVPATIRTGDVTVAPLAGVQIVTLGFTVLNAQGVCAKLGVVVKIKSAKVANKNAYALEKINFKERTDNAFQYQGFFQCQGFF